MQWQSLQEHLNILNHDDLNKASRLCGLTGLFADKHLWSVMSWTGHLADLSAG